MYRKLVLIVGAICLIVGPLGDLLWGVVSPVGEAASAKASVAAILADPGADRAAVWLDLAILLLIPAALFVGRVLQASVRPLVGVGSGLLFLGSLLFTYSLGNDVVLLAASQTDGAATAQAFAESGVVSLTTILAIVLQFVGVVLLGIAALRSRLIPVWAGVFLIAWNPVQVIGTVIGVKPVESLGDVLLLAAYAAVAVRLIRPVAGAVAAPRTARIPAAADH
ncbi:hypothetical protein [uncultured Amnibacterium sp.]|uniref:hypothetical protein n=1 Tax=uncultured Amnibacterium sp. TaxID=1631851 RepID=UPI0035CAA9AF